MKILHVVWRQKTGGAEIFALNLACYQSNVNEVYIYYLAATAEELSDIDGLNIVAGNFKSGFDVFGLARFAKYMIKNRFDVVHHHQNLSAVVINALFSNGSRIIKHEHGTTESSWKTRRERWMSAIVKYRVASYIANSNHTKQQLIKFEGIQEEKIIIIPCGIDLSRFSPDKHNVSSLRAELNLSDQVKIVGFVGRLVWEKGVDDFIKMASLLREKDCDAEFVIAGHGPLREELECLSLNMGLKNHLNFLGSRKDIEKIYKACNVICVTSRKEAQGLAVIEAMASGVPVVAFSVGGIPEVVANTGRLVNDRNIDEMANIVNSLLADNDALQKMKIAGINQSKKYDLKVINNQIVDLYHTICKSKLKNA